MNHRFEFDITGRDLEFDQMEVVLSNKLKTKQTREAAIEEAKDWARRFNRVLCKPQKRETDDTDTAQTGIESLFRR